MSPVIFAILVFLITLVAPQTIAPYDLNEEERLGRTGMCVLLAFFVTPLVTALVY